MGEVQLFVSHAHEDKEIVARLLKAIEAAMKPPSTEVREVTICTSLEDYRSPEYGRPGDVSDHLRDHLSETACVLAVLTPNSMGSAWVHFELGGAWMKAKHTYPLLAGLCTRVDFGANRARGTAHILGPLKESDSVHLGEKEELQIFLGELRQQLSWNELPSRGKEIEELAELANGPDHWHRTV